MTKNSQQVLRAMYEGLMDTSSGDPVYVKFNIESEMIQDGFTNQEKNAVVAELTALGYIERFTMHNFTITGDGILEAQDLPL